MKYELQRQEVTFSRWLPQRKVPGQGMAALGTPSSVFCFDSRMLPSKLGCWRSFPILPEREREREQSMEERRERGREREKERKRERH